MSMLEVMDMSVFFTVYKTTNLSNQKVYVGAHRTEDLDDGYLGSGTALTAAVKKYGAPNFRKEILFILDSSEEMMKKEAELVTQEFVSREDTYNLRVGGGSYDASVMGGLSGGEIHRLRVTLDQEYRQTLQLQASTTFKKLWSEGFIRPPSWVGRHHKEESKERMSESKKLASSGALNSQFGTLWAWVCRPGERRKISRDSLSSYLEAGWVPGTSYAVFENRKNRADSSAERAELVLLAAGRRMAEVNKSSGGCQGGRFGLVWVNLEGQSSKVDASEVQSLLNAGWELGRKKGSVAPSRKRASRPGDARKLDWEKVREIRRKYLNGGVTQEALSHEFGVSIVMISLIVRNKSWVDGSLRSSLPGILETQEVKSCGPP